MKKFAIFSLLCLTLLILNGCQSQNIWYLVLNCVVDIAPSRFNLEEDHKKISIPIVTSHPLDGTNHNTEYLIIMIHGGGLNAEGSFETAAKVIEGLKKPKDHFLFLAPQFIEGVKLDETGLLFWDRKWRSGGLSLSTGLNDGLPSLSSFEVIDRLIDVSVKQNPNIHRIIILGHSAGGQFVVRYAAINNQHEPLFKKGITVRYVVANPSSYPYLNETRYKFNSKGEVLKTSKEELADCSGFNGYKYGTDNLYGYAENLSKQTIRTRLLTRPVMFLLGAEDTGQGWMLDKPCEAEAQGMNRYERGMLFQHHLRTFTKSIQDSQHIWMEIPGVGHNSAEMFTHSEFITKLKTLDF